jgi:hypothetical protein
MDARRGDTLPIGCAGQTPPPSLGGEKGGFTSRGEVAGSYGESGPALAILASPVSDGAAGQDAAPARDTYARPVPRDSILRALTYEAVCSAWRIQRSQRTEPPFLGRRCRLMIVEAWVRVPCGAGKRVHRVLLGGHVSTAQDTDRDRRGATCHESCDDGADRWLIGFWSRCSRATNGPR